MWRKVWLTALQKQQVGCAARGMQDPAGAARPRERSTLITRISQGTL